MPFWKFFFSFKWLPENDFYAFWHKETVDLLAFKWLSGGAPTILEWLLSVIALEH